jgi:hypothetical protein
MAQTGKPNILVIWGDDIGISSRAERRPLQGIKKMH